MFFWYIIVGVAILIAGISVSFIAKKGKKPIYTIAEQDYAKLIIFQIMLGRDAELAAEFAKKSFIYYGCWLPTKDKPTYAPRSVEILRSPNGKAKLGRTVLQERLRWMFNYLRDASKIQAGELDRELEGEWIFKDDTGEIDFRFHTFFDWSWKTFLAYLAWGSGVVVNLVLGIVFQRWELLIGSGLALVQQVYSLCGGDYEATVEAVNVYLETAQQAYDKYGNVDSTQAQTWIKGSMDNYMYNKYGVEVEWN